MTSYPCPACGATADLAQGCPGCGRAPDPTAAEVIRLDQVIGELVAAVEAARVAYDEATRELETVRSRRNRLAAEVRVWSRSALAAPVAPVAPAAPVPPHETSVRTVQNVLFTLGGLLLGTAAVVFTAVAWATFRETGRAVILAIVTGLALGAPLLALRRRLVATAETFAALGLLLVVLDGYAAWHVNLFGLADTVAPSTYAAGVAVVTALVGAFYGRSTRLTGPHIVAFVAAQPALPLSTVDLSPGPAGWAVVFAVVAAGDLALLRWFRGPWRVLLFVLSGLSVIVAGANALQGEVFARDADDAVRAGLALLGVVLVLVAGAAVSGARPVREIASGVAGVALVVALGRYIGFAFPEHRLVLIAACTSAVAVVARTAVPPGWRLGARIGSGVSLGVVGIVVVGLALWAAWLTVAAAVPAWHADLGVVSFLDWGLVASLALVALGGIVVLPRGLRTGVPALAVVLGCAGLAPALALPWWAPSTVDVVGVALLVVLAAAGASAGSRAAEWAAVVLAGHAVLASFARPSSTAGILWALVVVGVLALAIGHRRQVGLAVALVLVPPAVQATAVAAGGSGSVALRWGLVAVGLTVAVVGVGAVPSWRGLRRSAVIGASVAVAYASSVAALGDREPYGVHGAIGLLLLAAIAWLAAATTAHSPAPEQSPAPGPSLERSPAPEPSPAQTWPPAIPALATESATPDPAGHRMPAMPALPTAGSARRRLLAIPAVAASLPAVPAILGAVPGLVTVLVLPYSWLGSVWSGVPASDPGLTPWGTWSVDRSAATLAIVAIAATLAGAVFGRRGAVSGAVLVGPAAILAIACATEARWPTVPFLALVLGLACAFGARWSVPAAGYAVALTGAGLAGLLPTKATTLAGLGLVVIAMAALRSPIGWLASFSAAVMLAIAATRAADLPLRAAAYAVLAVAAVALAASRVGSTALVASRAGATSAGDAAAPGGSAAPEGATSTGAAASFGGLASPGAAGSAGAGSDGSAGGVPAAGGPAPLSGAASPARPMSRDPFAAIEVAAHTAAVVAVVLAGGSLGHTAAIFTLWGIALALCALPPGPRVAYAAAAAGAELVAWWLLLSAREVAVLEAYTLPAAALAALVGVLALRRRPELRSWMAYGPALAAAFLPSLASALTTTSDPARRLLLGVGAVAVVCAGAVRRRQAPVAVGGLVLVALALREMAVWWDLIPRWIPLAAAGFLLVGLAMTYERRRRDLTRLREGFRRLT